MGMGRVGIGVRGILVSIVNFIIGIVALFITLTLDIHGKLAK